MNEQRPTRRGRSDGPWSDEHLVRWVGMVAVALILIVVAGVQVQGKTFHNQYVWIEVAAAGLILGSYATLIWVMRGRRAVGEKMERLLSVSDHHSRSIEPKVSADAPSEALVFVSHRSGSLYHRGECALVMGRDTVHGSRAVHEAAGRRPCGVCIP